MSTPTFNTRHTVTGAIQRLTEDQIEPFKNVLEIVADDAKPYEPGMFKPGEVGEFKNPEPAPDDVAQAQAAYDEILRDHAPNSKVAREAKQALESAEGRAEQARLEAEAANQQVQNGESVEPLASSEGEAQ